MPYDYYILNVNLDNKGLANILLSAGLTDDQMMRYGLLMQTLGKSRISSEITLTPSPSRMYCTMTSPAKP